MRQQKSSFHIPKIESDGNIHALILSPTRELALQTLGVCQLLTSTLPFITVGSAIGGLSRTPQESALRRDDLPTILVATPGRFVDLLLNLHPAVGREGGDKGKKRKGKDDKGKKNRGGKGKDVITASSAALDILSTIWCVVLDEADRLLEVGFQREIEKVMEMLPGHIKLHLDEAAARNTTKVMKKNKKDGALQVLFFTATMSRDVALLAQGVLERPVVVYPDGPLSDSRENAVDSDGKQEKKDDSARTPESILKKAMKHEMAASLVQEVIFVESESERDALCYLIAKDRLQRKDNSSSTENDGKAEEQPASQAGGVLIFANTRHRAHRMSVMLRMLGLSAMELHGGLSTGQRLFALECFKNGSRGNKDGEASQAGGKAKMSTSDYDDEFEDDDEDGQDGEGRRSGSDSAPTIHPSRGTCNILVSTDLAARGLDIDGVNVVLSYDEPRRLRDHIHRAGRTARIGHDGRCITLMMVKKKATDAVNALASQGKASSSEAGRGGIGEYIIPPLLVEMNRNSPGQILRRKVNKGSLKAALKETSSVSEDLRRVLKEEAADEELDEAEDKLERAEQMLSKKKKKKDDWDPDAEEEEGSKKVWFMSKREKMTERDKARKQILGGFDDEMEDEDESESDDESYGGKRNKMGNRKDGKSGKQRKISAFDEEDMNKKKIVGGKSLNDKYEVWKKEQNPFLKKKKDYRREENEDESDEDDEDNDDDSFESSDEESEEDRRGRGKKGNQQKKGEKGGKGGRQQNEHKSAFGPELPSRKERKAKAKGKLSEFDRKMKARGQSNKKLPPKPSKEIMMNARFAKKSFKLGKGGVRKGGFPNKSQKGRK
eukprot:MONOS_1778.1-p1 / transcript=MONOS_1778.1 / gene=MONOS_1778 / organism=Monocercomonoides_exilis_PA203 / gene_product=Probable ATP-dependent RNA helicase DDX27 / transcript_product=Probable ATP-dependent RNA helicase DDX27 / location=Mono_scaffold00033:87070-89660(+) / protein_length=833 / sequence_SO=supercontig / SO=protein_coding / is_pseudo=false